METKELMIGDWVKNCYGKKERVEQILESSVVLSYNETYYIGGIKPIPLTEKILKKNFERYNDRYYLGGSWKLQEYGEGKYEIGIVIDAYESPQFCGYFVVSSVHELQHFLRVSKINKEVEI